MKIAIPLFGTRISPRFDCAPGLLLITTDSKGKDIIEKNEIIFINNNYIERINQLKSSGVDVVICGGISNDMLELLKGQNIKVIPWVTGESQDALSLFLQRRLVPGTILCPGRRMKRWRFCQQVRQRRRGNG